MYSLEIENEEIYFKNIRPGDLPVVLEWYNRTDDFKYATGVDTPMTLEDLAGKYAEVAISCNEFFAGIYTKKQDMMIGLLKGSLKYKRKDAVWIRSIVIDTSHQNMGYGSLTVALLLKHLKTASNIENAYLAVLEENIKGRAFWSKNGFSEMRRVDNHLYLQDKRRNIIIMYKKI